MAFPPALLNLPSPLVEKVKNLYSIRGLVLIVSKPRKTKLGDCTVKPDKTGIITINSDLSPEQTFMTMIHELAHYHQFINYGFTGNKLQPHGPEWKMEYKKLMNNFFGFNYFDPETEKNMMRHMDKPSATVCRDVELYKNMNPGKQFVCDITVGDRFLHNFVVYEIMQKLKKNYKCKSELNGKMFIFQPLVNITIVSRKK